MKLAKVFKILKISVIIVVATGAFFVLLEQLKTDHEAMPTTITGFLVSPIAVNSYWIGSLFCLIFGFKKKNTPLIISGMTLGLSFISILISFIIFTLSERSSSGLSLRLIIASFVIGAGVLGYYYLFIRKQSRNTNQGQ